MTTRTWPLAALALVLALALLTGCATIGPHHCTDMDDCANDTSVHS